MLLSERKWTILFCGGLLSLICLATGTSAETVANQDSATADASAQRYSVADRERRLAEAALTAGKPLMIRIFKNESELELWMEKQGRFELFETYPICFWSGKLGPKKREGDRQAPEGFYDVDVHQLRLKGRNARSFYIDYPNALDRVLGRTGHSIMVHGRCTSIGCFAMTDPVKEEIYALVERALHEGQNHIEVHAFPFRMTDANLAAHARSEWYEYWLNLKDGYDLFEQTRVPPKVSVCGAKYVLDAGDLPGEAAMLPDIGTPPNSKTCEAEDEDIAAAQSAEAEKTPVQIKPRKVLVKRYSRHFAGRHARKAYAAARRVRMAVHARRVRTSEAAGKTRHE